MGRFSDTQELHRLVESMPPVSSQSPQGPRTTLERLLDAVCSAPVEGPLEDTVRWLLCAFAEVLPGFGLGIRLSSVDSAPPLVLRIPAACDRSSSPPSGDMRLFPDMAHERILPLPSRPAPSTFHCASNDSEVESTHGALAGILDWCATAASTVVRNADQCAQTSALGRERDQLRSALAQCDKLGSLGQLSAGIVHEMSNPLTSIAVYADYLRQKMGRQNLDPDDVLRIARIADAADVLLGFTRALKSYARPADDPPSAVDLSRVIDQALGFCLHAIDSGSVEVRRQIADGVPPVLGVPSELTQVFVNLLTNACQAMAPSGGVVTVAVQVADSPGKVRVTVSDSGPGISQEDLPHIFEPFFTTHQTTAGTGLGLSIVRQIVEKHAGTVAAASPAGSGCTFTIELPAVGDASPFHDADPV